MLEFLFYYVSQDVCEVMKVVSELGWFWLVKVLEFKYIEGVELKMGVVVVFFFGNWLCFYMLVKGM